MRLLWLAAVACTVLLVGCGGVSEEDGVKQAFDDYVQALEDKDGDKFCDSVAPPELAEMSADERAKEIELCKDDLSAKDFDEVGDAVDDAELGKVTVTGDRATAAVTATVKGRKVSSKARFLKVGGDWKVRFESR